MRPHVRKNTRSHQQHHQVSSVIPIFNNNPAIQSRPIQQQQQQCTHNNCNYNNNQHKNYERKKVIFDPIPMTYAELYPSLVVKNLIQPENPPYMPEPLPWWYKLDQHCTYHQGAPGHDIENCNPLKYEVQKLVKKWDGVL